MPGDHVEAPIGMQDPCSLPDRNRGDRVSDEVSVRPPDRLEQGDGGPRRVRVLLSDASGAHRARMHVGAVGPDSGGGRGRGGVHETLVALGIHRRRRPRGRLCVHHGDASVLAAEAPGGKRGCRPGRRSQRCRRSLVADGGLRGVEGSVCPATAGGRDARLGRVRDEGDRRSARERESTVRVHLARGREALRRSLRVEEREP